MFADDTMLFCRANVKEAKALDKCLKTYESWSGQWVTKEKSRVLFSPKTRDNIQPNILLALGMRTLKKDEKYLGNPIFFSKSQTLDFSFLKDKILSQLEGWRAKLLSQAGRGTLI